MKLFVTRYACGWEFAMPMLSGQTATELRPRVWQAIRKRHRLTCEVCQLTPSAGRQRGSNPSLTD